MNFWLMKSEPNAFSINDLEGMPKKTDHWDGIRNYQARNFMRDGMKKNDSVFFYHSNCKSPGIVGTMKVTREAYPDFTALDPNSPYYDPKHTTDNPRWLMVDITHTRTFQNTLTLQCLKECPELDGMLLLKKGNRLSITPVEKDHWDFIMKMVK